MKATRSMEAALEDVSRISPRAMTSPKLVSTVEVAGRSATADAPLPALSTRNSGQSATADVATGKASPPHPASGAGSGSDLMAELERVRAQNLLLAGNASSFATQAAEASREAEAVRAAAAQSIGQAAEAAARATASTVQAQLQASQQETQRLRAEAG